MRTTRRNLDSCAFSVSPVLKQPRFVTRAPTFGLCVQSRSNVYPSRSRGQKVADRVAQVHQSFENGT
jgi:hypothetical protein